jgi:bifunctional non-homologous end joining protein LigD
MQQEAVIGGITEPSGSRKHFGALMLGVYDQGKLRYVGHTGTGFSDEMLKDILKRLPPYFTDTCPLDPRPKANARVQWVKPKLVCEVAFQEWTSDGKLRAPAFLGFEGGQIANGSRARTFGVRRQSKFFRVSQSDFIRV